MKNLKIKQVIAIFAAATFFSCNNSAENSNYMEQVEASKEDIFIERNIINLSSADALKLAKQFSLNEHGEDSRAASEVAVKDIQTIVSESGETLMYAVNYANNKGFTVVCATKNYTPILAYSNEGYMNTKANIFTENPFINEYKHRISSVINVTCDSLRQKYAIDWSLYEKTPANVESRAYSNSEIQQKLSDARTYCTNQGYEVHSLSAATSLIPAAGGQTAEQRANGFINDICQHTPSEYDCMEVSLPLVKRINDYYGPYVYTSWKQGEPYNVGSTYGHAGCVAIAVTQMMYYYKWPNIFNWYNIGEHWVSLQNLSDDEIFFMTSVKEQLNLIETPNGVIFSEEYITNMVNTLKHYGYLVEQQNYTDIAMINKIKEGNPILVYGKDTTTDNEVHVWICDGYRNASVQYAAYMISSDLEDYTYFAGMTDHSGEFFHLNIGTGVNGWYYIDEVPYGEGNFVLNRKMFALTKNHALYE